ncbi:MAG: EamA family transporter [Lactobacillus sp.]
MTENKNNMKAAVLLVIIAATMSSASQLLWKIGADAKSSGLAILLYLLGFVLAGLGLVFLTGSYRFGPVSIMQPMMSLGYVWSIIFGAIFLAEAITTPKIIGTILIIVGSVLLGYEGGRE